MPAEFLAMGDKVKINPHNSNKEHIEGYIAGINEEDIDIALAEDIKKIAVEEDEAVILEVIKKDRKESLYVAEARLVQYIAKRNPECKLKITSEFIRIQRRYYVRVPVKFEVEYLASNGDSLNEGFFLDLSGGGALLNTVQELALGKEIVMRFNLEFKNETVPFEVKGRVVREDLAPRIWAEPNMPYKYGISFEGLTTLQQDHIIRFVMEQWREKIKNIF